MAERPVDSGDDITERRRVCCDGESLEKYGLFLCRQVELSSSTFGNVDGDDARDLFSERLDGD